MDRNQVIGFSLLAVLLIGYVMYNQHEQKAYQEQKHADSIAYAKAHPRATVDSIKATAAVNAENGLAEDSATMALRALQPPAYNGTAQTVTLENKKLSIEFSTKGANPNAASIKAYKTYKGKPLFLFNGKQNSLSATLPIDNGRTTADLYFQPVKRQEPNGDNSIDFMADLGNGKKVDIIYTLPADDYMMRCNIVLTGLTATALPLSWQTYVLPTEKDLANERLSTQVYYRNKDADHDYYTVQKDEKGIENTSNAGHWLGIRKQYFNSVLISDDGFTKMESKYSYKEGDTVIAAKNLAALEVALKPAGNVSTASLRWYIGPNDYHTLSAYKIDLDEMVPLGFGIMAFVKYINQWVIIPIFYFLASFVSNYAIIIMLMTLIIRLFLSFFTYKSY
jgi:YidC/Oxa1 family membrane protein insertase